MRGRLWTWAPAFGWCVLIFVLSAVPGSQLPEMPAANADKVVHAVVYAVLAALCLRPLRRSWPALPPWLAVAIAALLATIYGVSDELHQRLTPGRNADVNDVVADAIGAITGATGALIAAMMVARSGRSSAAGRR